jgi:hypothetical protein
MAAKSEPITEQIKKSANKRVLYLPHALNQMNTVERMISTSEVREVIFDGSVIEDYPDDIRGHSCLILGKGYNKRPIHVVCAPKPGYLAIITAYIPNPQKWESDWKTRKEQ